MDVGASRAGDQTSTPIRRTQPSRRSHGQRIDSPNACPVAQLANVITQMVVHHSPVPYRQLASKSLGFPGVVIGGDGADDGKGVRPCAAFWSPGLLCTAAS